jgi:DNA polymerase
VEVERGLDKRLLSLTPRETQLWLLDQKINNAGIAVDLKAARTAIEVVEIEKKRLNAELQEVSGNQIATYNAHAQVKRFIIDSGIQTSGVAKAEVSGLLERADLPAKVRRVLEIRQEAAKSSNKKLQSFVAGCNLDGRMRGIFQYHGAGTGRWAGRRVQPQNFPRPKIKQFDIEEIFGVLRKGDAKLALDFITVFHGSPMSIISQCLRGFMCGGVEQVLCAMDFIAVEARVLAWLAGEESVLEVFRTHGLIYEKTACDIYGIPMDMHMAKDDPRRQVGKVSDLALGFQGGVGALQKMAKTLGIKMAPALQGLWERAAGNVRERAMQRWAKEKKKALAAGISKYEWLASELTKVAWRAAHPEIVRYWSDVEEAALRAVKNPGEKCYAGVPGRGVTYLKRGSFLFCRLPSGRNLCYPYPKLEEIETPWGAKKTALTYMAENSTTKKWERQKAYGGLLVENNTQAVARDLLADAMLRLDAQNFRIVLHVHDEVVVELPQFFEASITVKGIERIVSQVPEWAAGLPLAAEGWAGKRYRK